MDYLTFINRTAKSDPAAPPIQFLVSGNDAVVRSHVFRDIICRCRENSQAIVVIDDTGTMDSVGCRILASSGYRIKSGMAGGYCLYNPFTIGTMKEVSRLRQLLSTFEWDEKQKGKLLSYLSLIRHIECIRNVSHAPALTPEKITEYSTVQAMEEHLQSLVEAGLIDERQRMALLAKYAECCSAAADLEDLLPVLIPFIKGEKIAPNKTNAPQALWFCTGELGEDETIRTMAIQLIQFSLEEKSGENITLIVFDRGIGNRKCILDLLKTMPEHIKTHVLSEDIFTLCDPSTLAMILNRFNTRIYGRHLAMESCEAIEKACGAMDVVKNSYQVTYDRRWAANRPWDILMGNNKTESYTQTAPAREPRYRKEMIMNLAAGSGIVEFMGNTSVFTI